MDCANDRVYPSALPSVAIMIEQPGAAVAVQDKTQPENLIKDERYRGSSLGARNSGSDHLSHNYVVLSGGDFRRNSDSGLYYSAPQS